MEEWKEIPLSNGLYYASNFGQIKRIESIVRNQPITNNNVGYRKVGGKILKQKTKKNKYMEVNMYIAPNVSKMYYVHRAVYFAFNPNDDMSLQINHKNFDKSDNRIDNLELVTASENMLHAYNGQKIKLISKTGEDSKLSKLKTKDVLEIRELYKQTKQITNIAKMFGIGNSQVQRIVKRKSWNHI